MNVATNKISPGYKQTEVGVIPEGWEVEKLVDVIDVYRGGSPRPIQQYLTNSLQGINWIKIGDVGVGAKYIEHTDEKIIEKGVQYSRRISVGDFLLSNSMSFGRPYISRINGCIHDGWLVLQNYKDSFDQEYLYYNLSSKVVLNQYLQMAAGSSVLNLNKELVSAVLLIKPSKPEQSMIAFVLSDIDELTKKKEKLIAKKNAIKQGAMQELLTGKRRLPGFEKSKGLKQTEIGSIPTDWSINYLPSIANTINGKAHEKHVVDNVGKYVVVNSKFISSEGTIIKYCNHNFSPAIKGDVLMVLSDLPNGKALAKCFYIEKSNKYAINQRVCAYRTNKMDSKFLYYFLNRNDYFLKFDDGVSQTHILSNSIKKCPIIIPPNKDEQKAIANVLSDMDYEIDYLEKDLAKYRKIKTGMMQQLLTGKIRLVN